jgi:parvulin-like peptidyl-prolyl isomerase
MKSIPSFILCASIFTAMPLFAADPPKKPAAEAPAKPAAAEKDKPKAAADKAPADKAPADKAPAKAPTAVVLKDPVAVVEGEEIKSAELQAAFDQVVKAQNIALEEMPPEEIMNGYRMILDDIILEKLVNKRAAKMEVTDAEVEARIEGFRARFGSAEAFAAQLAKSGVTMDKVKEDVRDSLRQERWLDSQIAGKDKVTDAEVEAMYKQNIGQFEEKEQVRASHILILVPEGATPDVVAAKKKAAQAIAERVKKGEPFDKLAKELSEDPTAKENSGDLDFFEREQMVPEFSDAAFKMKKGDISDPVQSKYGFHVIKVTDHKDGGTMSLEQAKPKLLAYLQQQKKQTEMKKIVTDIRDKADVKINLPEAKAAPAPEPAPAAPAPATPAAKATPAPKAKP